MKRSAFKTLWAAIALVVLAGCSSGSPKTADQPWTYGQVWLTDLDQAQVQAKAEKRRIFVSFTGSDWCPGCQVLRASVFDTPEFAEFAKSNLVLVEIDFPRRKPQSEALQKTNEELAVKYGVEGFPTVILFDGDGRSLNREVGYNGGSAKEYVARLKTLGK